jgi:pimeloyl-ACP methyl ester carboxylesterase
MKAINVLIQSMIIAAIALSSCNRNDKPNYEYLLSSEYTGKYERAEITGILDVLAQSYPEVLELGEFVSDGIRLYTITYSSFVKGKVITASGLVSVPGMPGEYPVVSFQNDINTLKSNCPSENPTDYLYQLVESVASMGFIVLMPDYPGFGSSSGIPHPYLLKVPTSESVIRMIQAVYEAENEFDGITVKNECYLIGYSQGGLATFNAHTDLELGYSSYGLKLRGSACGAGPYEMEQVMADMRSVQSYPAPASAGYIINAWTYYGYITNPINELLKEPYASRLRQLYDGYHSIAEINSQLTASMPDFFTDNFRNNSGQVDFSSVGASLVWNSAYAYKTEIPVLLMHGGTDTQVSVSNTETLHSLMILHGTSPEMCKKVILPGMDHSEAVIPFMVGGLKFLINLRDS